MKKEHPSTFLKRRANTAGNTFIVTMMIMTVLSLVAAHEMLTLTERWRFDMQANSWQEAAYAAESGADMAMVALTTGTWTSWTSGTGGSVSSKPAIGGTNTYSTTLSHTAGEGSNKLAVIVKVDAPSGLSDTNGQCYRIRSTGISQLPRTVPLGYEPSVLDVNGNKNPHSNMLRKFSFITDNSGGLVAKPQVARTIEIIARGPSPFTGALVLNQWLTMSGGGVIDAFDSSNSTYSSSGLYSSGKREPSSSNTVSIINTEGATDIGSTYIYGNLAYNGTTPKNTSNVQGTVSAPSTATTGPVLAPTWTVLTGGGPSSVNGSATFNAGSASSPTYYKVSSVNVPGGAVMTLHNPTPGQTVYVNIWVTGDFQTSGSGYIQQEAGVVATYYIQGNINISGASFNNSSNLAANCIIYGVTPTDGTTRSFQVSGSGVFIGAVDAPMYNFNISGSANFSGSLVGNTMQISGGASVHYDNALSKLGGSHPGYTVVSWVDATP